MSNENNYQEGNNKDYVYSIRLRAGKRRTYFFDVRTTRANDYFLTITESKRRFDDNGYERHKIFLYKEDFNKFKDALEEATDYVKTELLPDYDFDQFSHDGSYEEENKEAVEETDTTDEGSDATAEAIEPSEASEATASVADSVESESDSGIEEEADKW